MQLYQACMCTSRQGCLLSTGTQTGDANRYRADIQGAPLYIPTYICVTPTVDNRGYPYTSQLLNLERASGQRTPNPHQLPREWREVITPMRIEFWRSELVSHPDQSFVTWICEGIKLGFHTGFSDKEVELHSARSNMISAIEHPQIVTNYIKGELASHHLLRVGPISSPNLPSVHVSPLGVILKKGCPDCWRLIMDLSSPHGHSVNDGICKELCSLHYSSIDDTAAQVVALGPGSMLAKMDIRQAYRNIPVAPEDKYLLGLLWDNQIYIDQVLPFGLRSAPMIFSAIADALLWIMLKKGVSWGIHYIDDFLTIGAPTGPNVCRTLG